MFEEIVKFIKSLYPDQNPVPLHAPVFFGREKEYLADCIDSTYVSYVGKYVNKFEAMTAEYTGAKYAIAIVNGTAALQIALETAGVKPGDEVITQPLTFVATANAISHCGAKPIFIDVDLDTMGLSPEKLEAWLKKNTKISNFSMPSITINKLNDKTISAVVPMHTYGFPCRIDEIVEVANRYNIPVIEDAAESLGSFYKNRHTGTFGLAGILSYNGNKTITTGGGGMIITNDEGLAKKAKHITTTAKIPHPYEFVHDEIAYNYRMPNINAAIGVSQMENIHTIINKKRATASLYEEFCRKHHINYVTEIKPSKANYWLNTILLKDTTSRDDFLIYSNKNNIQTRPAWTLMNKLRMYSNNIKGDLTNALELEREVINLPSSIRINN